MTRRGKAVLGSIVAVLALAGAAFGYVALTGDTNIPIISDIVQPEPPPVCPLSGQVAETAEQVDVPVVAVKVENSSSARPQAGLNEAEIVYEEPVEGGITRFIALYHCQGSDRIGPVRSARLVDPDVLRQYGRPLFVYAGGVDEVFRAIEQAGLVDMNFLPFEPLYHIDPNRSAPHNLFIATQEFRDEADDGEPPPEEIFTFDEAPPEPTASKPARRIHADFSPSADVTWKYSKKRDLWQRFHDDERHRLEQGAVRANNVVVQIVKVRPGTILDAAGNPSPEIDVIGEGKVYVFRNGRVIEGTWSRPRRKDPTEFLDAAGEPIALAPGNTWIELFPKAEPFDFS